MILQPVLPADLALLAPHPADSRDPTVTAPTLYHRGHNPRQLIRRTLGVLLAIGSGVALQTSSAAEPPPGSSAYFGGKIGLTAERSVPNWPKAVSASAGAPNIVVILLDDVGFGDTSTFGGLAQTPELDKLAAQGLRYNNFNTTAMCSPTRAALLTGRNHHRVGFGVITEYAGGYPGYDSIWKDSAASIAEVLRRRGYSTSAFGKWHNTPDWEISPIGPFDRWPTGRGFEYFYGFMGPAGMENQWEPTRLYRNTTPVDAPATPKQGYHLTTDITDEAIRWIDEHEARAPDKPYFLYFATGAVHAPHHAPREWIDRYRGAFDMGWDQLNAEIFKRQQHLGVIPSHTELTPRPSEIPAWASLSTDRKKLYARQMEVYAGFISHTDYEVGRLLKEVRSGASGDNTLVLYIVGDNGASGGGPLDGYAWGATTVAEQLRQIDKLGGPEIPMNLYSGGWAWAGDTPFQYWKTIASHFGGVRDPLVVSWPAKIKKVGGLRSQFTHVTDVAATLYDVVGISLPLSVNGVEQQPLDGVSFAQTFNDSGAPSAHHTQYFELLGNRALYNDGWVAAARHQSATDWFGTTDTDYSKDRWELYHVSEDFSEAHNLALQRPDKVEELKDLFDQEAKKNGVYPLGGSRSPGKPSLTDGRRELTYLSSEQRIPVADVPPLGTMSYRISADVVIPESGAQGILASCGDRAYGFTWYVKDGHVVYENKAGTHHEMITSRTRLPPGKVRLVYEFQRDNPTPARGDDWDHTAGKGRLYINGVLAGQASFSSVELSDDRALYVGHATGAAVSDAYTQPFTFTGGIEQIKVELR
jgi:arylsulfatase A-like enzyme